MSFLKGIFGKADGNAAEDPLAPQFDEEFHRAVRRFGIVSGYGDAFKLTLRHPETREPMAPHLGIAPYFETWKTIRSPWDRVELFFRYFMESRGSENFDPWAVANILTSLRLPQEALELLNKYELSEPDSSVYARHCGAFARAMIPLERREESVQWARRASEAAPDDTRLRLLLGDALRLKGETDEAAAIYSKLMETAAPAPDEAADPIGDVFSRLFAVETGVVSSPFFALDIVGTLEDAEQAAQFWKLGEAEFYDSPHFRMQHAYYMVGMRQVQEAFAKLAVVVQEMPWLREAQINLLQLFRYLDPEGTSLMTELRQRVEQTIREQNWRTDGMQLLEISVESE
jgi:tetratricopeptide (TPR) repeat protein